MGLLSLYLYENRTVGIRTNISYQMRLGPGTDYESVGSTPVGAVYRIKERIQGQATSYGNTWYHVEAGPQGSVYIIMDKENQDKLNTQAYRQLHSLSQRIDGLQWEDEDGLFIESLKQFPSSYQEPLRKLHRLYPNWTFHAFYVEDSWEHVLDAQTSPEDRSLVQGGEGFFERYQWMIKNDTVYDGVNWYPATREGVAYYMDPRNFLDVHGIFQFLDLSNTGNREDGIESIFQGNADLLPLVPYLREAAGEAKIMPEALAIRIRQEVSIGNTISLVAKGLLHPDYPPLRENSPSPIYLDLDTQLEQLENPQRALTSDEEAILQALRAGGEGFPEIEERFYNFYNIGSYPDPEQISGAMMNGARFAAGQTISPDELAFQEYLLPWRTPELAVLGGAHYIVKQYINRGQSTNYLQKFDLVSGDYSHQYMQSIYAALHEGNRMAQTLIEAGEIQNNYRFIIPVYQGMPEFSQEWGKHA